MPDSEVYFVGSPSRKHFTHTNGVYEEWEKLNMLIITERQDDLFAFP